MIAKTIDADSIMRSRAAWARLDFAAIPRESRQGAATHALGPMFPRLRGCGLKKNARTFSRVADAGGEFRLRADPAIALKDAVLRGNWRLQPRQRRVRKGGVLECRSEADKHAAPPPVSKSPIRTAEIIPVASTDGVRFTCPGTV